MRIEAYIRVVGDEATIRAIHRETGVRNASMKRLKAGRGVSGKEMWWGWKTAETPIKPDRFDEELQDMLNTHKSIFPILKRNQEKTDIYLEVVSWYDEGEEPQGLYLSSETVQLLNEMGAALDNDVVVAVAGKSRNVGHGRRAAHPPSRF